MGGSQGETGRRRIRVGPATLVSVLALALAIAGGAGALPGRNSVNSGDIKQGAVKRGDHAKNQRADWALLELDAAPRILSQSGGIVLEAADSEQGFAFVRFPGSVLGRVPAAHTTSSNDAAARAVPCGAPPLAADCSDALNTGRHVYVSVGAPPDDALVYLTLLPK